MSNLDERLLAGNTLSPEQENAAAGELRERKRGVAGEETGAETDSNNEPQSFREKIKAAQQALNLKEMAKKKVEEKVVAPVKQATSRALRWAWEVSIPSFGLGLIYVNIHVFLRFVLGERFFCKLGEEWLPELIGGAVGQAGKTINKNIGIIEVIVLLILDLIVLLIILGILSLLVMIATWLGASWWGKLKMIYDALKSLGWATIEALVSLFQ